MCKKILIINPFGIGDVLFTTPIIHSLKDTLGDIKIGYLCNRRTASILESNPYIDSIFVYERDEFEMVRRKSFFAWLGKVSKFIKQIKREHFDIALDFSLNTQYGFLSWCTGIKERIGYDYKKRGIFLTKKINLTGYSEKHIVEYYAALLEYLGLDSKYKYLEFYLKEEDKEKAKEILAKEDIIPFSFLIGIIPGAGASWGQDAVLKHWPIENFAQLADKIVENYKAKIIIVGDFSEKEIAQKIIKNMRNRAVDLSGITTLGELAALLNEMDLIIANDGGPLHIAAALGKKTVSFFGPVDPKVYGPYPSDANRHIVLRRILACSPCYHDFRLNPCQRNKECLRNIGVQQAYEAVSRLLSERGK